jgi:peptidoglycan/LPS O-acetylase OafA/YrhL
MNYVKQLDTLRIFAVFGVVLSHWIVGPKLVDRTSILAKFPLSTMVDFFFVLSGFLITTILLTNREDADLTGKTNFNILKSFYIRRALRILPIYYLYILVTYRLFPGTIPNFDNSKWFYLTHSINFYYYLINAWEGVNGHFWSLSVEEQFYLVWPFVILYSPRKHLIHSIILFIIIGSLSQVLFSETSSFFGKLPFSCLDCFGLGGLLSYLMKYHENSKQKFAGILLVGAIVSFFIIYLSLRFSFDFVIPKRTLAGIISMWLVFYIVYKQSSENFFYQKILGNHVLTYLGKLSYGVYIYHNIIPYIPVFEYLNKAWAIVAPSSLLALTNHHVVKWTLLLNGSFLLMVSIISYQLIEKPFLSFKRYFN